MSNELQTAQQKPLTVANFLNQDSIQKYVQSMLKDRTGQFIASLTSLSSLTPGLAKCDPKTLLQCGLKATSLNLPLDNNLGFAYAVPYGDKASFQIGYRGLVQLAQRTGQYKTINVIDIRAGELVKFDMFTEEIELSLIPDMEKREKQAVVGYAATFELVNGFKKVVYWTKERVTAHGKRFSKSFNSGPWKTDFDAMAKKTVLKDLLSKWGPMSIELTEAVKADQAVITVDDSGVETVEYIDSQNVVEVEIVENPETDAEFEKFKAERAGANDTNKG
jgi:recombination protein RecT